MDRREVLNPNHTWFPGGIANKLCCCGRGGCKSLIPNTSSLSLEKLGSNYEMFQQENIAKQQQRTLNVLILKIALKKYRSRLAV